MGSLSSLAPEEENWKAPWSKLIRLRLLFGLPMHEREKEKNGKKEKRPSLRGHGLMHSLEGSGEKKIRRL